MTTKGSRRPRAPLGAAVRQRRPVGAAGRGQGCPVTGTTGQDRKAGRRTKRTASGVRRASMLPRGRVRRPEPRRIPRRGVCRCPGSRPRRSSRRVRRRIRCIPNLPSSNPRWWFRNPIRNPTLRIPTRGLRGRRRPTSRPLNHRPPWHRARSRSKILSGRGWRQGRRRRSGRCDSSRPKVVCLRGGRVRMVVDRLIIAWRRNRRAPRGAYSPLPWRTA